MWVTVPVTDRSRSPSTRETPTAAPGARSGTGPGAVAPPPPMTGAKPIAEKTPRAQSKVSGSKPEKTSGSARGLRVAPATLGGSGSPRKAPGKSGRSGRRRAAATAARSRGAAAPPAGDGRRAEEARGCGAVGGGHHVADRGDSRDRLLAERERVGHRAHEPAVDEDGAAAHAGDDAGLGEGPALEAGEDEALAGADGVLEDPEDPHAELVDAGSLEDGAADAPHAGAHVGEGQGLGGEDGPGGEGDEEAERDPGHRGHVRVGMRRAQRALDRVPVGPLGSRVRREKLVAIEEKNVSETRAASAARDSSRTVAAGLLAWVWPGLGHLFLGRRGKGLVLMGSILALFGLGVAMDSRLQLHLGLEDPLALLFSLAQMGAGAPYVIARLLGYEAGLVTSPTYEYGNTFTAVGGLLNILVVLDALDTARGVRGK